MSRPRVVIAGGGVAGMEVLLALSALAGNRVDITLVSPEVKFSNQSMSVAHPFAPKRGHGIRLQKVCAELDARWVRSELKRVEPARLAAVTRHNEQLFYDLLVLAPGARPEEWVSRSLFNRERHALSYRGDRDSADYRLLLDRVYEGQINKLAFVRPPGPSWPLPLYDLALLTSARCLAHGRADVELSLVTPEEEPLGSFGRNASEAIRRLLEEAGVAVHTSSYGRPSRPGRLDICPGDRSMDVDRVITEPRLAGPRLRGVPCDPDGFIPTDAHGRVRGLENVFAAGDATTFPVKQGGLAAQQADAVAETIAASVGVEIDPQAFRPVLRGVLLTGGPPRYLRSDISGAAGDDSVISARALWWPPNKLAGRYLAPYLSRQVGEAADVMPEDAHAIAVERELDAGTPEAWPVLADLPGLRPV